MFIKVLDVLFFFFYHIILLTRNITYVIIYLDTGMCFLIAKMHKMKEVQVDLKKLPASGFGSTPRRLTLEEIFGY